MSWIGELPEIEGTEYVKYFTEWSWDIVDVLADNGVNIPQKDLTLMEIARLSHKIGKPLIKVEK